MPQHRTSRKPLLRELIALEIKHQRTSSKDLANVITFLQGPTGRSYKRASGTAIALQPIGHQPVNLVTLLDLKEAEKARNGDVGDDRRRGNRFILRALVARGIAEGHWPAGWLGELPCLPRPSTKTRHWLRPPQLRFLLKTAQEVLDDYRVFAIYVLASTGVRSFELPELKQDSLDVDQEFRI